MLILELVFLLASVRLLKSGKKITDQRKDVSGPMHFKCDISLLQSLTDWKPKHTIEEGIRLTYERMGKWGN